MSSDDRVESTSAPSMLDLLRLSPRLLFPPGGRDLYRQVALLTDLGAGDEVLVVGSANGVTLEYFVREYGAHGSGVDFDDSLVARASERARAEGLADRMQYQHAPLDQLPFRDEIFDVAVGELSLTAHADPERAVHELARVTRPGGRVVLLQLVWKAPVDPERRGVLSAHLGVHPLMLVEWKRLLRESGLENLHTEDWSDEETAFRPHVAKPFPDFAEIFSLGEKLGIYRRAWKRWGWSGVRAAISREREVHRLLTRERILGLDLVKAVKKVPEGPAAAGPMETPGVEASPDVPTAQERAAPGPPTVSGDDPRQQAVDETPPTSENTDGLPLFGGEPDPS